MSMRAPGKAMLFGEYAVLEGAPAIVAAVDRYAIATVGPAGERSTFVDEAVAAASTWLRSRGIDEPAGGVGVDSSALYADGAGRRKLGLGSSAAVTVSAFGACLAAAGAALDERAKIYAACAEAHARAQRSRGSGADVAAAVWGGVIRFLPTGGAPMVTALQLSPSIEVTLVDTGVSASTGERLARLDELRAREPERHRSLLRPLADLAAAVAGEVELSGAIPLAAIVEWNLALEALAAALDLPIVTERHKAVADCARAVGGAAKPSGAGGGDLAVCFAPAGTRARLRDELSRRGLAPLPMALAAAGLSPVASSSPSPSESP